MISIIFFMKTNALREYFATYSTAERKGIASLSILLVLLIITKALLPIFIKPKANLDSAKYAAAWEKIKAYNTEKAIAADSPLPDAVLFPFDPNTLDSVGFLKLGMRPKTVHMLLNWRNHGKHFYKPEDLKGLYTLTEEEYAKLAPYIAITGGGSRPGYMPHSWPSNNYPPLPAVIELNTADSFTLVRLNGIGPTLAHKITERRKLLGGFLRHDQLLEVYKFPDSTYAMLQQRLRISPQGFRKLNINTATTEELAAHPYIGAKVAANIVMMREGLKSFSKIEQLRQVPLMNEEIYRKIAPYCSVE